MIRKYALVVLNNKDEIIDRYNLDIITNPTDNGFSLELSKLNGDIEDIITKVVQKHNQIKMSVIHYSNAYTNSTILTNWIQKYSTAEYKMCLEYNDTNIIKYCEGKVISLTKSEKDEFGTLTQVLTFQQTTPYFIKKNNTIRIATSSVGKKYPFTYPYSYGVNITENNIINNPYILETPLIVTIKGAISNPTVSLVDENNNTYNTVRFSNISLLENEKIIINSAQKKIVKVNALGVETEYGREIDPSYQKFLRAKRGLSTIVVNTSDASTGFELIGGWRQYTL